MFNRLAILTLVLSAPIAQTPAVAADGLVLINHAKALAGKVTPGDLPGYPVTLSVQGSYKLSGNLSAPPGVNGIDAAAVDTTIDLNGFRIEGSNAGNIGILGTQRNLTVRNGTVQRFVTAVKLGGGSPVVEDMRLSENTGEGVSVTDGFARLNRNTIINNRPASVGVRCGEAAYCHLGNNLITLNLAGVILQQGALYGNTIVQNRFGGIQGTGTNSISIGGNTLMQNGIVNFTPPGSFVRQIPNNCVPACP